MLAEVTGRGASDLLAATEGLFEHRAIGVFDLGAGSDAAGETRYGDGGVGEQARDVQRSRVAVERGVGGEDDLADVAGLDALNERVDREVLGFDAFEGGRCGP